MIDFLYKKLIEILSNSFTYVLIDIILNSLMAFLAIVTYGKTKKVSSLLLVLSSLFFYLLMVTRVLSRLGILIITEFKFFDLPVIQYLLEYFPIILIILAFLSLIKDKED